MSRFDVVVTRYPRKSVFPMRNRIIGDVALGKLYPIFRRVVLPGDYWRISPRCQLTFMPLVAPIMASITAYVHYYFVPWRELYARTVDEDGNTYANLNKYQKWISGGENNEFDEDWTSLQTAGAYSLDDYFGFPIVNCSSFSQPSSMWRRAYNMIYNWYYRNQNYQDEVDLEQSQILRRNWRRDYFTSILPSRQRGNAVQLSSPATYSPVFAREFGGTSLAHFGLQFASVSPIDSNKNFFNISVHGLYSGDKGGSVTFNGNRSSSAVESMTVGTQPNSVNNTSFDLVAQSPSIAFSIEELRLANSLQKWQELNMRSGIRYTELLQAHFGVSPADGLLQQPTYIGGMQFPITVVKVTQQSSTDNTSPQGNLAGNASGFGVRRNCVRYRASEFGVIIGLLSIMPKPLYQYGISPEMRIRNRYDIPWPLFQGLGEQQVTQAELYASDDLGEDTKVIGYQARWEQYRTADDYVVGRMRSNASQSMDYWHFGRKWDSAPAINADFLECHPSKRNFAVQNMPEIAMDFCNHIRVVRAISKFATPHL